MRISLNIECETLEDFQKVMLALGKAPDITPAATVQAVAETIDRLKAETAVEAPVVEPELVKVPPVEEQTPPVAMQQQPVEAKKRAPRTRKAAPPPPPEKPAEVVPTANGNGAAIASATKDDLMNIFRDYVQRYGTNAGYADVSKILQQTFGDSVRKASDVSEEHYGKAVLVVRQAIETNPFNRKRADA